MDLMTHSLVQQAAEFAKHWHGEQKRKYTGVPYWTHCEEVASIVMVVTQDPEMVAAAWLHDTLEDTDCTFDHLVETFGLGVANMVGWLTDVSKPEDGNRAVRKAKDRLHIAKAIPDAKTIKLADLMSNTSSIVQHDSNFARVYLKEKEFLLEVLREGSGILWHSVQEQLLRSKAVLRGEVFDGS